MWTVKVDIVLLNYINGKLICYNSSACGQENLEFNKRAARLLDHVR